MKSYRDKLRLDPILDEPILNERGNTLQTVIITAVLVLATIGATIATYTTISQKAATTNGEIPTLQPFFPDVFADESPVDVGDPLTNGGSVTVEISAFPLPASSLS